MIIQTTTDEQRADRVVPTPGRAASVRGHDNSFTLVCIVAAFLIMIRHSGILLGPDASTAPLAAIPPIGFMMLVSVSGYLLVPSWNRRRSAGMFLVNRIARIYPGYVVGLVITVGLIGALTTSLSLADYFRNGRTWNYFLNFLLNPQYNLPGVFDSNPVVSTVNGSLWSLPGQMSCYLLIPLVCALRSKRYRIVLWTVLACATGAMHLITRSDGIVIWGSQLSDLAMIWPTFCVAALLAELKFRPNPLWLLLLWPAAILMFWSLPAGFEVLSYWTLIPLATIASGLITWKPFVSIGRRGNPSFGIYLYGFPIQQLLIAGFGSTHAPISVLLTGLITVSLAYLSLQIVEQPSARLIGRLTKGQAVRSDDRPHMPDEKPRQPVSA